MTMTLPALCSRCDSSNLGRDADGETYCMRCGNVMYTQKPLPPPLTVAERTRAVTLPPRLMEALRHVADGATNREVAAALQVTHQVARHYIREVKDRLGIESREGLITYWQGVRTYLDAEPEG